METTKNKKQQWTQWVLPVALCIPIILIELFQWLKDDRAMMNAWVSIIAPFEQFWGRVWNIFPFSVAELLTALFLIGNAVWLVRAIVLAVRGRDLKKLFHRIMALAAVWLWLWAGLCWMWNTSYYATTFTEKSGLSSQGHTPQQVFDTTVWFAQNAARLSTQVERDGNGHFAEDQKGYFQRGPQIYDNLVQEFPFLEMPSVRAKPLICSRLQSILGFTGVYFPFTGEANVNADAPACLRPATIAHEMAHQRMVAAEQEANFVGIAAAVSCDDVVFQYSGYLMGLMELSDALYQLSPDAWYAVAEAFFTPELSADWQDNHDYWAALESPVDQAATQAYDSFLKGNGQVLGMASYGACVDLLITYFCPAPPQP